MAQRIPVPELAENEKTNGCLHGHVTAPRLEGDCHVTTPCVDDALGQDGAQLGERVLVLVSDDLGVVLTVEGRLWRH